MLIALRVSFINYAVSFIWMELNVKLLKHFLIIFLIIFIYAFNTSDVKNSDDKVASNKEA